MKYEIGDLVVCKKTGREGRVFDYGWLNPNNLSLDSLCDSILVKLGDLQLEIWHCDNVKKSYENITATC